MSKRSQYLGLITLVCLVVGIIVSIVEIATLSWPVWGPTIAMGFFLGIPISEKIINGASHEWSVMWTDISVYAALYSVYILAIKFAVPAMF